MERKRVLANSPVPPTKQIAKTTYSTQDPAFGLTERPLESDGPATAGDADGSRLSCFLWIREYIPEEGNRSIEQR